MPQVLVVERTATRGARITISAPRVLHRVVGSGDIPGWVAGGAVVTP